MESLKHCKLPCSQMAISGYIMTKLNNQKNTNITNKTIDLLIKLHKKNIILENPLPEYEVLKEIYNSSIDPSQPAQPTCCDTLCLKCFIKYIIKNPEDSYVMHIVSTYTNPDELENFVNKVINKKPHKSIEIMQNFINSDTFQMSNCIIKLITNKIIKSCNSKSLIKQLAKFIIKNINKISNIISELEKLINEATITDQTFYKLNYYNKILSLILLLNQTLPISTPINYKYLMDKKCEIRWYYKVLNELSYDYSSRIFILSLHAIKNIYINFVKYLFQKKNSSVYGQLNNYYSIMSQYHNIIDKIICKLIADDGNKEICMDDMYSMLLDYAYYTFSVQPPSNPMHPVVVLMIDISQPGKITNNYHLSYYAIDILEMKKLYTINYTDYTFGIISLLALVSKKETSDTENMKIKIGCYSILLNVLINGNKGETACPLVGTSEGTPVETVIREPVETVISPSKRDIEMAFTINKQAVLVLINMLISDIHLHIDSIIKMFDNTDFLTRLAYFTSSVQMIINLMNLLRRLLQVSTFVSVILDKIIINDFALLMNVMSKLIKNMIDKDLIMNKTEMIGLINHYFNCLLSEPVFMEHLKSDTVNYDNENYRNVLEYFVDNVNEDKDNILEYGIDYLNKLDELVIENEESSIPEEFLDPLTCMPITNPIMLPNTKNILDFVTISKYLLSKNENPFNREHLTMEIIEEFNNREEIREEIEIFKNKFLEWKNSKK